MDDIDQLLNDLETVTIAEPEPPKTTVISAEISPIELTMPVFVTTNTKNLKAIFQTRKGSVSPSVAKKPLSTPPKTNAVTEASHNTLSESSSSLSLDTQSADKKSVSADSSGDKISPFPSGRPSSNSTKPTPIFSRKTTVSTSASSPGSVPSTPLLETTASLRPSSLFTQKSSVTAPFAPTSLEATFPPVAPKPTSAFARKQTVAVSIQSNTPPDIVTPKICHTCKEPIDTPSYITTTCGKTYHSNHFTCSNPTCNKPLKGTTYIERDTDGSAYCKNCFTILFSEACEYCKSPIIDTCVKAVGQTFHVDCFFCCHCGENLGRNSTPFVEESGKVYCIKDHGLLFARVCIGCGNKVASGEFVEISKEKVYHLECFRCSIAGCSVLLSPNEFYQGDAGPICQMHYYQMQDAVCSACDKIVIGACVNALGKRYHRGCFACTFCKKGLDGGGAGGSNGDKFKSKNGNPYCCLCHLKLFG